MMNKRVSGSVSGQQTVLSFLSRVTDSASLAGALCISILLASTALAAEPTSELSPSSDERITEILQYDASDLSALSVGELRDLASEVEAAIPQAGVAAQEMQKQVFISRREALSDPAVLELQAQIGELKRKIEQTIDGLPDVKAKTEIAELKKGQMLDLMQFRTKVLATISQKERGVESAKVEGSNP